MTTDPSMFCRLKTNTYGKPSRKYNHNVVRCGTCLTATLGPCFLLVKNHLRALGSTHVGRVQPSLFRCRFLPASCVALRPVLHYIFPGTGGIMVGIPPDIPVLGPNKIWKRWSTWYQSGC